MAKIQDPYAEFRKTKLNEREVNLLKRRINDGKISYRELGFIDYDLTADQVKKGYSWLMNQWKTPKGVERKNNPFSYREQHILQNMKTIRLTGFYNAGNRYMSYMTPIYSVYSNDMKFDYIINGGKIDIVG